MAKFSDLPAGCIDRGDGLYLSKSPSYGREIWGKNSQKNYIFLPVFYSIMLHIHYFLYFKMYLGGNFYLQIPVSNEVVVLEYYSHMK